jgi:transcriptional regulator with XRE-family HTH domain
LHERACRCLLVGVPSTLQVHTRSAYLPSPGQFLLKVTHQLLSPQALLRRRGVSPLTLAVRRWPLGPLPVRQDNARRFRMPRAPAKPPAAARSRRPTERNRKPSPLPRHIEIRQRRLPVTLSAALKQARKRAGMTQAEAAEGIGIAPEVPGSLGWLWRLELQHPALWGGPRAGARCALAVGNPRCSTIALTPPAPFTYANTLKPASTPQARQHFQGERPFQQPGPVQTGCALLPKAPPPSRQRRGSPP